MTAWWMGLWTSRALAGDSGCALGCDPLAEDARAAWADAREQDGCGVEANIARGWLDDVRTPPTQRDACTERVPGEQALLRALVDAPDPATLDTARQALVRHVATHLPALGPAPRRDAALRIVALAPDQPDVVQAAAGALWSAGDAAAARHLYQALAARLDVDEEVRTALASLAWDASDLDETVRWLDTLPPDAPRVAELRAEVARRARREAAETHLTKLPPREARRAIEALVHDAPHEVALLLALARAERADGAPDEAERTLARARAMAPLDPWVTVAEADLLLARGATAEARDKLDTLPKDVDAKVRAVADMLRANALRAAGDAERGAGRHGAALLKYAESLALVDDPWTRIGMAGVYVATQTWPEARATYEAVTATTPPFEGPEDDRPTAALREIAIRGHAGVLEATGNVSAALAELDALVTARPSEANRAQRDAVAARMAVAYLDALRRTGHLDEAGEGLKELAMERADDADVQAALAAARLDAGDARGAVQAALFALRQDPAHAWAVDTLARAAEPCHCVREAIAWVEAARLAHAERAVVHLPRLRVLAAIESADVDKRRHRRDLARATLREAQASMPDDAQAWRALGEAWQRQGRSRRARTCMTRASALAPRDPTVAWAHAKLLKRQHRARAARAVLDAAGVAPEVKPSQEPAATTSERHVPEPETRARVAGTPASAVLFRSGLPGVQRTLAVWTPVTATLHARHGGQWGVEAVPIQVEDGVSTDRGVSVSASWRSAPAGSLQAAARVGTSPLGFSGGAYPVGAASLRLGTDTVTIDVMAARVPLHESLPAWAGAVDPTEGRRYGGVSFAHAGLGLGAAGEVADAGVLGRGGVVSGVLMAPNPRGEVIAWLGGQGGGPKVRARVGAELLGHANRDQADAFRAGGGAYYSPPLFGAATLRADAAWDLPRLRVCVGARGGAQYATGIDSAWFAAGTRPVFGARIALGRPSPRHRVELRAEALHVLGGGGVLPWTQATGAFTWRVGADRDEATLTPDAASPLSTSGPWGAGVAAAEVPC